MLWEEIEQLWEKGLITTEDGYSIFASNPEYFDFEDLLTMIKSHSRFFDFYSTIMSEVYDWEDFYLKGGKK